jgi:hypothetical protein
MVFFEGLFFPALNSRYRGLRGSLLWLSACSSLLWGATALAQGTFNLDSPVNQEILAACQTEIDQKVGSPVTIATMSLREFYVSQQETRVRGRGQVNSGGKSRQLVFDCVANVVTDQISSLSITDADAPGAPRSGPAVVATPSGSPLVVRKGPGSNYTAVYSIPNGRTIGMSGRVSGNWAETVQGYWVYRAYVQFR